MDLKEVKKILKEEKLSPNKKLGQNFLVDKNVRDKILSLLPLGKDDTAIEIGPGFGVMTFELAKKCKKLIAVEKDRGICRVMERFFKDRENIELVNDDILQFDFCGHKLKDKKLFVYGNIPYNISTPIIEKIIDSRDNVKGLYIVVQDEVADRIAASPGSKTYGSLSCYVQYHASVKKLFKIKKNSFYPSPKVGSALLALDILSFPSVKVKDEALMFTIIRQAFSQRRKKAVNPLASGEVAGLGKEEWERVFSECGLSISARAETIALTDYAQLSDRALEKIEDI